MRQEENAGPVSLLAALLMFFMATLHVYFTSMIRYRIKF
jgi:hypothetical protein